ncbi:MAG: aspartyl protease family protein [Pseudomonadales bacterium]
MKTPVWLVLIVVAFGIGLLAGKRWGEEAQELVTAPAPAVPAPTSAEPARPTVTVPGFAEAVAARDWDALVAMLESASFENRDSDHAQLYGGMRRVAADLVAAGAVDDVVVLLGSFAELNPQDHEVRFQLALALQAVDRFVEALAPTFEILQAPLTHEVRVRAQLLRDELVSAEVERLERQDEIDPNQALIALYESLVQQEPVNDQHRAALAQAYLAAGEVAAASQTIDAIAGYGVPAATIEELRSAVALARSGIELRQEATGMFASVRVAGQGLDLLLDTGATQTALTPAALESVQAVRLERSVNVRTAGGPIVAPLYQLGEFEFAGTRFSDLEVIALGSLPPGTDGLLGMDVLSVVGEIAIEQ